MLHALVENPALPHDFSKSLPLLFAKLMRRTSRPASHPEREHPIPARVWRVNVPFALNGCKRVGRPPKVATAKFESEFCDVS